MKSERQKREEEIERLLRGEGLSREPDPGFQEKIKKAASAIIEEDAGRTEKSERAAARTAFIRPQTAGLWLLVLGAALSFSMPPAGALLIIGGIGVIVWSLRHSSKKSN